MPLRWCWLDCKRAPDFLPVFSSLHSKILINDDRVLARTDFLACVNSKCLPKARDVGEWGPVRHASIQIEAVVVSEGHWVPVTNHSKICGAIKIALPHLTCLPQVTATARHHDADKEQKPA